MCTMKNVIPITSLVLLLTTSALLSAQHEEEYLLSDQLYYAIGNPFAYQENRDTIVTRYVKFVVTGGNDLYTYVDAAEVVFEPSFRLNYRPRKPVKVLNRNLPDDFHALLVPIAISTYDACQNQELTEYLEARKWNSKAGTVDSLGYKMTPFHVICQGKRSH